MLHYILIIFSYSLFIGIICDQKRSGKMGRDTVNWSTTIAFGAIYFFCLTYVYEKLLQHILLNRINSYKGYILFSGASSGIYCILFFLGIIILGKAMICELPNVWTWLVFLISIIINVTLIIKAVDLYYEAMVKAFGENVFDDLYTSLSKTKRPDLTNTLLNLKWIVMICPCAAYLIQLLRSHSDNS